MISRSQRRKIVRSTYHLVTVPGADPGFFERAASMKSRGAGSHFHFISFTGRVALQQSIGLAVQQRSARLESFIAIFACFSPC